MKFLNVIESAKLVKQDAQHRFITDAERVKWTNAADEGGGTKVVSSPTEPTLRAGDQWYREVI